MSDNTNAAIAVRHCLHCGGAIPRCLPSGKWRSRKEYARLRFCCPDCWYAYRNAHDLVPQNLPPAQRPDQWERCARGHALSAQTRVVRPNGLVECRTCWRESNLAYQQRKRQGELEAERREGWVRLAHVEEEYGLSEDVVRRQIAKGTVRTERAWPGSTLILVRADDLEPLFIRRGEIPAHEAMALLGVSRQRVSQLVQRGQVRGRHVGGALYVERASVDERLYAVGRPDERREDAS